MMQSKKSFFNGTLFKKNIFRFWPLWAIAGFAGFIITLSAFMTGNFGGGITERYITSTLAMGAAINPILVIFYALACAIIVWRYLFNSSSIGMLHSLPISRESLFVTNYLSGLTIMIIPYFVMGLIVALVSIIFGAFNLHAFITAGLVCLGEIFFFFTLATFICFLVGNIGVFIGTYLVINFAAIGLEFIISTFAYGSITGYVYEYNGYIEFLSPVVKMVSTLMPDYFGGTGDYTLSNPSIVLWYALASIPIAIVSLILYKRRSSEISGEAFVSRISKTFFRVLITTLMGLIGGRLAYEIIFIAESSKRVHIVSLAICVFIFALIGYFGATMIAKKTIKVFGIKSLIPVAAIAVIVATLAFLLKIDVLGIEKKVPAADTVKMVSVDFGSNSKEIETAIGEYYKDDMRAYFYEDFTDAASIENTITLHKVFLNELDTLKAIEEKGEYDYNNSSIRITYTFTNDKKLSREYDYSYEDISSDTINKALLSFIKSCPEYVPDYEETIKDY